MKSSFDNFFKTLMLLEGGFVNSPKDPGGATKMGITKKAWEAYKGREVSLQDMQGIKETDAYDFYHAEYWQRILGDLLGYGIDICVFDAAVHSGVHQASKWLQMCVGVPEDGRIGLITYRATAHTPREILISRYCALRAEKMADFPAFETYRKGWLKRVARVEEEAMSLVKKSLAQ